MRNNRLHKMDKFSIVKIILVWILPVLLLIGSIILFIESAWIYMFVHDSLERLDGFASLILAGCHFLGFLISASIATALTVLINKKGKNTRH